MGNLFHLKSINIQIYVLIEFIEAKYSEANVFQNIHNCKNPLAQAGDPPQAAAVGRTNIHPVAACSPSPLGFLNPLISLFKNKGS